jgi:NhaP-type Na+/H+ or K+/H+ antiporter
MRDNGGVSTDDQPEPAADRGAQPHAADEASEPVQPEASAPVEPVVETETSRDEVVVRRAPRYGAFLLVGAVVGALVALVLSLAFTPDPDRVAQDFTYDPGQVFGFLLLGGVAIGAALGALTALIVDRALARRTKRVVAERDETHRVDD